MDAEKKDTFRGKQEEGGGFQSETMICEVKIM
jgi:hypothetical protein